MLRKEAELKFFTDKYKEEYNFKQKIASLEAKVKDLTSSKASFQSVELELSPTRKLRDRALSKNSRINLEITQELENENELRTLQIENANFHSKVVSLEETVTNANKTISELKANNEDLNSLVCSLEGEVSDLRSRE